MRTIKFRGKRIDNGEWIYGDLLTSNGTECEISDWNTVDYSRHDVFIETVGQFTGLFDKKGKEIYEGDIIKAPSGRKYAVIWDTLIRDEVREFIIDRYQFTGWCIGFLVGEPLELLDSEVAEGEIIGNIYDNPKLLEGGEK